ncbi:MAG TPA: FKBP-type peptidyl-prolyl cis-trans isomerase [Saprospiraceae bacterium]|nr:FKBP-type peptidyl-prolyl cis-trans isomerase [Saprospiraceae bacterium]
MTIEPKKVVLVHYTLTEGDAQGEQIESTQGGEPLGFIYGIGMMIPSFEENLAGLKAGDEFAFGIGAADAYGEYDETAIVEVPKNMFETDGKIPDGLLEIGNVLPLTDQEGRHFRATVAWVGLETVKLDFNHPMAGVDLFFTGKVESVRDADPAELEHGHVHGAGGHHH